MLMGEVAHNNKKKPKTSSYPSVLDTIQSQQNEADTESVTEEDIDNASIYSGT